jgi:Holliday junction resolvase-like predicted endonuclease
VEVKTRNKPAHLELLSKSQMRRICNAGEYYISQNKDALDKDCRFDFISIIDGRIKDHIENAWVCEFD